MNNIQQIQQIAAFGVQFPDLIKPSDALQRIAELAGQHTIPEPVKADPPAKTPEPAAAQPQSQPAKPESSKKASKRGGNGKEWTAGEIKIIQDNLWSMTATQLHALLPGRTLATVSNRLATLRNKSREEEKSKK